MEKLRSLDSYKQMHSKTASEKGVKEEFKNARTLTEARRILFGEKKKQYVATRTRGSNKR